MDDSVRLEALLLRKSMDNSIWLEALLLRFLCQLFSEEFISEVQDDMHCKILYMLWSVSQYLVPDY